MSNETGTLETDEVNETGTLGSNEAGMPVAKIMEPLRYAATERPNTHTGDSSVEAARAPQVAGQPELRVVGKPPSADTGGSVSPASGVFQAGGNNGQEVASEVLWVDMEGELGTDSSLTKHPAVAALAAHAVATGGSKSGQRGDVNAASWWRGIGWDWGGFGTPVPVTLSSKHAEKDGTLPLAQRSPKDSGSQGLPVISHTQPMASHSQYPRPTSATYPAPPTYLTSPAHSAEYATLL